MQVSSQDLGKRLHSLEVTLLNRCTVYKELAFGLSNSRFSVDDFLTIKNGTQGEFLRHMSQQSRFKSKRRLESPKQRRGPFCHHHTSELELDFRMRKLS